MLDSKTEIINWLREKLIYKYTINEDLTVDVEDDVYLVNEDLIVLPVRFNKINGFFDCSRNQLESLEGCPKYIRNEFICNWNKLSSLKWFPLEVGAGINCSDNELISLEYAPIKVDGDFNCKNNKLKNLINGPVNVSKKYMCDNNQLESLEGFPLYVGETFTFDMNPLPEILKGMSIEDIIKYNERVKLLEKLKTEIKQDNNSNKKTKI